jgi:hypothetical protein
LSAGLRLNKLRLERADKLVMVRISIFGELINDEMSSAIVLFCSYSPPWPVVIDFKTISQIDQIDE